MHFIWCTLIKNVKCWLENVMMKGSYVTSVSFKMTEALHVKTKRKSDCSVSSKILLYFAWQKLKINLHLLFAILNKKYNQIKVLWRWSSHKEGLNGEQWQTYFSVYVVTYVCIFTTPVIFFFYLVKYFNICTTTGWTTLNDAS